MHKKEFSSFDLYAIVKELKDKLANSRINNLYQLDTKTLLVKLHKTNEGSSRLVLEAGRRLHLTSYSLEKPQTPPQFCMTLRKYLPGAWIDSVEQHEFERIALFRVKTKTITMLLILELFGEGNVILTSENGGILQALLFKRMRDRNIVRGEGYKFPPSTGKNPFKITREELEPNLKTMSDTEVVRAIVRALGFGGIYSEELLLRAGIEKTTLCNQLTKADFDAIHLSLRVLLDAVAAEKLDPGIVLDEAGGFVDVVPFRLRRYKDLGFKSYPTFSEALDEFYVRVTAAEKAVAGINVGEFKREAERLQRMISEQEKALKRDETVMAREKQIGDAVYEHFNELTDLLDKFSSAWTQGRNLRDIVEEVLKAKQSGKAPETFFHSFDFRNLAVNISIGDLSFSLSLRKTLYDNAATYYDRGKLAKQKMAGATVAAEDSRKKLVEIEKRLSEVEALKAAAPSEALEQLAARKVESKEWFEKFRWFRSSEDVLVVAGKDVVSNEVLLKKYTEPNDVVFHADIVGSPFAVVKTAGKEPAEKTLRETAEFAAAYSRAWRENMGSVDVYYVRPEQLSKSGPSGEFIPHGAFAVTGKRNWMRGTQLRLAVGVTEDCAGFLGGPLDAVRAKTKTYVVLLPGDMAGKELLKQILRSLMLKLSKEARDTMRKASIEDIREFVPYTKARVLVNG